MRRLVALLIAATLVLSFGLVGCGGGGGDDEAAAPAPAAAPVAAKGEPEDPDRSPKEGQVYTAFPTADDALPKEIAQRLETDQPMVVYFFDSAQRTTNDQDEFLAPVLKDYRGLIDLVKYDVAKYASTDSSGAITVDEAALSEGTGDETGLKVARLISSENLDVRFTPYILLVDSHGYIVWRFRGPVDSEILEREVLRATQ